MLLHQSLDALYGIEQRADRCIVVERVDQVCYVLTHIYLDEPVSGRELGTAVNEVGGEHLIKYALLCANVKLLNALGEQTKGAEAEYAVCALLLELLANVKHRLTRRDHIVNDDRILAVEILSEVLVCLDGVTAVYDDGVVCCLVRSCSTCNGTLHPRRER